VDGIPDFVISETYQDSLTETDMTWLDPEIVEARDTMYHFCARELKGMAFCMSEIGRRSGPGCRILEVGMGTGHFTRWLAEATRPGTEIYSFDFSWPIIEKAKANTQGLTNIWFFRANARGRLPFPNESFAILLLRLAPLGAQGYPNVRAGYELLKAGGWYFEAGWRPVRYETPAVEWAMQHGYESAERHEWIYWRTQSESEWRAFQLELERLAAQGSRSAQEALEQGRNTSIGPDEDGSIQKRTYENLLIVQKPRRQR
jgi:SAM-dependent methyltransferase